MTADGASLSAGAACLFLLASAIWAHYRFAHFDRLPRQFGLTLKPTSYAPSWVMIWLVPLLLIASLIVIAFLPSFVPPEHINGDPKHGLMIASAVMAATQVWILWLLTRWANQQA
ncbi:MAG: hypothetical protein AAF251_17775 [Pseudomonadota bacterium]